MPETPSQPIGQAARSLDSASVLDRLNRYRGCLLARACGVALGAPVEFWRRRQIIDRLGEPGINDYLTAYGRVGAGDAGETWRGAEPDRYAPGVPVRALWPTEFAAGAKPGAVHQLLQP